LGIDLDISSTGTRPEANSNIIQTTTPIEAVVQIVDPESEDDDVLLSNLVAVHPAVKLIVKPAVNNLIGNGESNIRFQKSRNALL